MQQDQNISVVSGRLTEQPELKEAGKGKVVNTSIASVDIYGDEEYTNFFDVTVWGVQAENLVKYCVKGQHITVHGRLKQERWEKEEKKNSRVQIIAEKVFWGNKPKGAGDQGE